MVLATSERQSFHIELGRHNPAMSAIKPGL